MKRISTSRQQGYTLMEMILVLGIIAILLGMGTFLMVNVLGDAEEGKAKADIQAIHSSLIRYKTNGGMYPSTEQGLKALVSRPSGAPAPKSWKQLMKESALTDPWGSPYQYRYPGKYNPDSYDIFSVGLDKKEGTEDDIGNWE
ncbi:MAG: type II secretion system major pseudopilin GspG [Verrucomicrobiae bacterium]|nr:type II secretion system major pseudopilin GspG [Verrucomicrobiae bacterium]